jgi:hypothetical protein
MSAHLRTHWKGLHIVNGGYDRFRGEEALRTGHADAVAFGRAFLANPDLPRRLNLEAALNQPDPKTFYGGGAEGDTTYPALSRAIQLSVWERDRSALTVLLRRTEILITHGLPLGILDKIASSGEHLGCEELTATVQRVRPMLHIFGHIHSGHGQCGQDGSRFHNYSFGNILEIARQRPNAIAWEGRNETTFPRKQNRRSIKPVRLLVACAIRRSHEYLRWGLIPIVSSL